MARNETTATSTVLLNGEQAKQQLEVLEQKAKDLRKALRDSQKVGDLEGIKKYNKELTETQKQLRKVRGEAFDAKKVLDNISGAAPKELEAAKRKLETLLRGGGVKRHSQEWNELRNSLLKVKKELADVNKEMSIGESRTSKFVNGFNKYFAAITAGVAALTGVTLGLKKFMEMRNEVEDSQANLQSLTGLGDQDIAWLRQYAKELSTTTTEAGVRIKASSKEIMDGFTTIGSKRPELLKNKEAMADVTKQALTLAAAGKMDVATAFDVVTASMNQFNLGASESSRIINVLAAGSLEGSAEADSLAGSLKNVGTVADGSNMSLEDTVAMLEVLASKQLLGEEAGTKLRGAILKMKDAGVGYVSGAFNVRDAIIEVNKQLDKKTTAAKKDALMQKIFGAENITVGQILVKNVEAYDKLKIAVTGTNTAYKQAVIQTDTVSAKMAQAKNKFNEAGMELVKNLNPAILSATNLTTMFLKGLVQLPKWISENKGLLITLATASAAYAIAINRARIASLAWYVTEKGKVALASASRLLEVAHVAALRVRIAVTGQATFAELRLVAAQKAMNATMLLNVYVAVAAAIAAISYAAYKLATRTTDAQKAIKEFNQEAATQQRELNNIFEAYKKANPKTEEKARLLAIIKEKYGPYIKDLINEKGEIINIEKAQLQANKALAQSIALKTKNKYIDENAAKEIEFQAEKMTKLRDELISDKGASLADVLVGEVGAIFQKNINDPLKSGAKEAFALLDKYKLMSGPLDRKNYGEIINGIASSFYRINLKSKEFDAIFKGLIGDFKAVDDIVTTTDTVTDTTTTTTGGDDETEKEKEKRYKKAEEALENSLKRRKLFIDEAYREKAIIENTYTELSIANEITGLEEKIKLQKKFGKDTVDNELALSAAKLRLQEAQLKQESDYQKALADVKKMNFGLGDEEVDDTEIVKFKKRYDLFLDLKDKYGLDETALFQKQKQLELDILDEFLRKGLLSEKDAFEVKKQLMSQEFELKTRSAREGAAAISDIAGSLSSTIQGFQDAEESRISRKYDREIAAARKAGKDTTKLEEEKNEELAAIRAKNADKAFAIQVAGIIASTAAAAIDAYASAVKVPGIGLVLAPIAAGAAVAYGMSQVAQANEAREAAKEGYFDGGYHGYTGGTDPREVRGTFPDGQPYHGMEFIANHKATAHTPFRRVFDLADYAQKTNSVASVTTADIARAVGISQGYYSGGYRVVETSPSGVNVPSADNAYLQQALDESRAINAALLAQLRAGIKSKVTVSGNDGIQEATDTYNQLIKNAKG